MNPDYFQHIASIALREPLAEVLGAQPPGEPLVYTFADAAKFAGHVCPTVAGAWLVTERALLALYPGEVPERGGVEVRVGGDSERTGAFGGVIGYLTGAAGEAGFGGLFGRHRRRDLLSFDPSLAGWSRFTRLDTGDAVKVRFDASAVPDPPGLSDALLLVARGEAGTQDQARFGRLWQQKVAAILTRFRNEVIQVRPIPRERKAAS
jgi:hypothetical protein